MADLPILRLIIAHWVGFERPNGGWEKGRFWLQILFPVIALVVVFSRNPHLDSSDLGVMLAVIAVMTGLLFQLLLSVLGMVQRLHDQLREVGNRASTPIYLGYLKQLDNDIAYAVALGIAVACLLGAGLFVGPIAESVRRIAVALTAGAMMHFAMSLFLVLARYRVASWKVMHDAQVDLDQQADRY